MEVIFTLKGEFHQEMIGLELFLLTNALQGLVVLSIQFDYAFNCAYVIVALFTHAVRIRSNI